MIGATNIVKSSNKRKYLFSAYGIPFHGAGSWSFCEDFAWNIVIFNDDNSSSSHIDNRRNSFLVLGEGPNDDTNGVSGAVENKFSINFSISKDKI